MIRENPYNRISQYCLLKTPMNFILLYPFAKTISLINRFFNVSRGCCNQIINPEKGESLLIAVPKFSFAFRYNRGNHRITRYINYCT